MAQSVPRMVCHGEVAVIAVALRADAAAVAPAIVGAVKGHHAVRLCLIAVARARPLVDAEVVVGIGLVHCGLQAGLVRLRRHAVLQFARGLGLTEETIACASCIARLACRAVVAPSRVQAPEPPRRRRRRRRARGLKLGAVAQSVLVGVCGVAVVAEVSIGIPKLGLCRVAHLVRAQPIAWAVGWVCGIDRRLLVLAIVIDVHTAVVARL
jgi:hypothetical protein